LRDLPVRRVAGSRSPNRIAEIVANRRRITADTALRLSLYFSNGPEFWLNLQSHYDLRVARRQLSADAAERSRTPRKTAR
jgi:plasmid maintenance system antidote protein VapI